MVRLNCIDNLISFHVCSRHSSSTSRKPHRHTKPPMSLSIQASTVHPASIGRLHQRPIATTDSASTDVMKRAAQEAQRKKKFMTILRALGMCWHLLRPLASQGAASAVQSWACSEFLAETCRWRTSHLP